MNIFAKPALTFIASYLVLSFNSVSKKQSDIINGDLKPMPKIQAAILLDVSNSMDGLIEQAKAQLWTMVNTLGKAKCEGITPNIEIALYEYGRDENSRAQGYVKQISPFTLDLDKLSEDLFSLSTHGGQEYCGQVIYTSLKELSWDNYASSYKVIFISGNEDFLQGNISYTLACKEAAEKGVIVNTIYCGDRMQGIREHWNLLGECGNGNFSNINSNAGPEDIPTPYDSSLITLNWKLNDTYVYFGEKGKQKYASQYKADSLNFAINGYVSANRVVAKGNSGLYFNAGWDLVDAASNDKDILEKLDLKTLPDSVRQLSKKELQGYIDDKAVQRKAIQNEILSINAKREKFIAEERKKNVSGSKDSNLESEIQKMILEQGKRFNLKFE